MTASATADLPPIQAQFLKANIADAYAEADKHPIAIVKRDVRTHVLMSAQAYDALAKADAILADQAELIAQRAAAVEIVRNLVRDSLANDFNEHWDSYTDAVALLTSIQAGGAS